MLSADLQNEAGSAGWRGGLADLLREQYLCFEALLSLFLEEEELLRSKSAGPLAEVRRKKKNVLDTICLFESQIDSLRRRWNETGKPHGLVGAVVAEHAKRNRGILAKILVVGQELASH
jgi:hypothetical protein